MVLKIKDRKMGRAFCILGIDEKWEIFLDSIKGHLENINVDGVILYVEF
jgi:hypothetical protein